MASDGSLHFDTTLDTEGFEKGSDKLKKAVSDLEDSVKNLGESTKTATSEALENAGEEASRLLNSLQKMSDEWQDISITDLNLDQYNALQDALKSISQQAREARRELEQTATADTGNEDFTTTLQQLANVEAAAKRAGGSIRREFIFHNIFDGLRAGLSSLWDTLTKIASAAARAGAELGRIAGRGIINGIRLLGRAFQTVGKAVLSVGERLRGFMSRAAGASLSARGLVRELTSLRTMLLSRVKSMFIRELTEGVSNGLKALIQYSSTLDASVSSMKNALTGLSANISVAFANLINAVAPAVSQIIDWLSTAITYLNAFLAMLSGKSVMTVAKRQTGSYAASLNDAAGSATKAAGAQKELNEQVYGFDQLNKRNKESGGSGSGGGGGGGTPYSDLFEEVPIDSILPEEIKNFFDDIKEAFKEGDWEQIGRIVAKGMNSVVLAIDDWITENRPKIVNASKDIADLLNGFVDEFNSYKLGETVGNGLNTILEAVNTFLTRFNNFRLGQKIADAFNGLNTSMNWDLLGQTIANGLNSIIQTFEGFAYQLNWGSIGTNLGTAVQSFADTLDLNSIVHSVQLSVDGIALAINNLYENVNWKENAENLAKKFGELFDGESENSIDWYSLGKAIANGFNIAIETFSGLVGNLENWKNAGTSLGEAVVGMIENVNWEEVKNGITGFINGVFTGVEAFLNTLPWGDMGSQLWTLITDLISGINWSGDGGVADTIATAINSVIDFVTGFLKSFKVSGLVEGFNNLLYRTADGIDWIGFAEAITDVLIDIVQALYGAIFGVAGLLDGALASLFDSLGWKDAAEYMRQAEQDVYAELEKGEDEFFGPLKTLIHESVIQTKEDAIKDIRESAGDIEEEVSKSVKTVADGVRDNDNSITDEIEDLCKGVEKTVSGYTKDIQSEVSETMTGLSEDVYVASGDISDTLSESSQKAYDTLTKQYSDIQQSLHTEIQQMIDDHSRGSDKIQETVSKALTATSGDMATRLGEMEKAVSDSAKKVESTVDSSLATTVSTVDTKTGEMKTKNENTWTEISSYTDTKSADAKDKATNNFTLMETELSSKAADIEASIKETWGNLETDTETAYNDIKTTATDKTEETKNDVVDKWKTLHKETNTELDSVKTDVGKKMSDIEGEVKNADWTSHGTNLISGFWNGLKKKWDDVSLWVSTRMNSLNTTIMDLFNLGSPSRLWEYYGEMLMAGLEIGLDDSSDNVIDTVENIAKEINDESMELGIDKADPRLLDAMDAFATRLEAVSVALYSVSRSLGNAITPTVAYGMEVPYQARISDVSVTPDNMDDNAITDTLDDQTYVLKQIRNLLERMHLKVDGEDIVRGVSSAQRGITRAYGGA